MATFAKEALFPSQFYGLSPSGGRVRVAYTPKDISHLNKRLKEMIAHGLQIPVSKEHQSSAKPMGMEDFERYQAEKAWATCGWVKDGWVNQDGSLCVVVDVPDEDDAKRVAVIRYVSPEIVSDFMDGSGKVWQGLSITHLAVTPRPVQHKQSPFERVQARLSLTHPPAVRLSLGGPMADEYEDDTTLDEGVDEGGDVGEEYTDDMTDESNEMADEPDDVAAESKIPELVEIMRDAFGVDIAGHVTSPEEFIDHLYTAALTAKAHQEQGMDDDEEGIPGSDEYSDTGDAEEVPQDVMMSMLRQQNQSLLARIQSEERTKLRKRVDNLLKTGRVGKKTHQRLVQELTTVKLSLGNDGNVKRNAVVGMIEAFEQNDAKPNRTARLGMSNYEHEAQEVKQPGQDKSKRPLDPDVMTKLTKGQYKGDKK